MQRYHYRLFPNDHGWDFGPVGQEIRTIDSPCTDDGCPREHVLVFTEQQLADHISAYLSNLATVITE